VIECFLNGERIAVHARSYVQYRHSTLAEHMPAAHREQAEWTPERIKRWADKIGPQTAKFIEHMIASRAFPQQAFRACLGLLRLAKRYSKDRLEKACTRASVPQPISISHENIRGSIYYK
jgi:transposase